ncbi:hypothetical protein CBR_g36835 [Chara braunii]|uniref:G-protein coupled receptors family 2 profile 2 domain-containing protein n=1 Tax=Chara braunii TaxID=69332 RepID=A0A388LLT7_CHABU|nr:hypothetical protein CBR_g36835 [Chara braunii]|eukprot:GBG83221.1 hypothetical protein CBR_g36835 [Chara braunii]
MLCFLQGMLTQFFSVASFLWTTTIMYTLHRTVVRHKADVEELEPTYHLYVWATSFVMTVIPIIGNDYGHAGAWCGVENGTLFGKILRFITFYLPLWGAILFNGVGYFQVIRTLGHTMKMAQSMSDRKQQMEVRINSKAVNRLSYYPLILIASWAFATINKVYDFIRPTHPIFWLYCAHVATASLMGLFNSIAYGLNSTVRRTLRERILEHLPDKYKRFWVSEWLTSPPTAFIQLENIYLDDSFAISGRDSAASDQSQL